MAREAGLRQDAWWYRTSTMVKRFLLIAAIAVLAGLSLYVYLRQRADTRLNTGEVTSSPDQSGNRDTSASPAGQSKAQVDRSSAANDMNGQLASSPSQPVISPSGSMVSPIDGSSQTTVPATDSIAPNPPNGAAFTGTGRYQVYRQGNLTWRVNTDDGSTCILFATEEEWRKPLVYNHGCRSSEAFIGPAHRRSGGGPV